MATDKKYASDKETLEGQLEKVKEMIEGDKKTIAENDAIARDPNHILDQQGEWAKARKKGNLDALSRHQSMYTDTTRRLEIESLKLTLDGLRADVEKKEELIRLEKNPSRKQELRDMKAESEAKILVISQKINQLEN